MVVTISLVDNWASVWPPISRDCPKHEVRVTGTTSSLYRVVVARIVLTAIELYEFDENHLLDVDHQSRVRDSHREAYSNPEPVAGMVIALVLLRVEFDVIYAVVGDLVMLPSRSVKGKTSYPDPRAVALVVKPLLKYPSCHALDDVVRGTDVLASESVAACWTVVFDTKGVEVELWYEMDAVDELPIETVSPQAMPKQ